jgi:hypothetical protein
MTAQETLKLLDIMEKAFDIASDESTTKEEKAKAEKTLGETKRLLGGGINVSEEFMEEMVRIHEIEDDDEAHDAFEALLDRDENQ